MSGWSRAGLLLAALLAPGGDSPPPGSVLRLEVPLPAGWQQASRVVLMLEDVATPRGQAFIVRVCATAPGEPDQPLGRFGVLAEMAGAPGMRPPVTYRVDVTRGLRRWAERHPQAKTVHLALSTVGPRSQPIVADWRVGCARLIPRGLTPTS